MRRVFSLIETSAVPILVDILKKTHGVKTLDIVKDIFGDTVKAYMDETFQWDVYICLQVSSVHVFELFVFHNGIYNAFARCWISSEEIS